MKTSKKIIFFLLILSILFFTPQTDAQNEELADEYCVTETQCIAMTEDSEMTQEICNDNNGIIISQEQYQTGACNFVCCCFQYTSEEILEAYCEELSGEIEAIEPGYDCAQICGEGISTQRHTLFAEVKGPNNEDATGEYTLYFTNGEEKTSGQFEDGDIEINELLPLEYILRTKIEITDNELLLSCTKETQIEIIDSNININIQINAQDCEQITDPDEPETPTCQSAWIYEFSLNGCGEVLDIYDMNECEESTSQPIYEVGDFIECIDLPEGLCGNEQFDEGEQCEIINNVTQFADGITSCYDVGYDEGILRCSNCMIDESFCITCPTDPADCVGDSLLCSCSVCQSEPLCTTDAQECVDGDDLTLEVSRMFQQEAGLRLEWYTTAECLEDASVKIYERRCGQGQTECEPVDILQESWPANNTPYHRTNFPVYPDDRYYCYKIDLTADNGAVLNSAPPPVCIQLPHPLCVGKPDGTQFCHGNQKAECLSGLLHYTGGCEDGEQCINPSNRAPFCVSSQICDACSGPFGLFGFLMYEEPNFEVDGYNCIETETENICFREDFSKTKSALGRFNQCGEVKTCYDYVTKGSCERNTCEMPGGEPNACEWIPFKEGELGFGVCKPQSEELQNCNACDENSPGGFCSREMCALYGDDCYYNEDPKGEFEIDKYYCNNKEDVGCETFNTAQECHAGSILDIDIQYDGDYQPTGGTHQILNPSENELNRQICVWEEEKCIRDADFTTSIIPGAISDCMGHNKACLLDFIAPTTNVTIKGEPIISGETYSTRQLYTQALQVLVSETARTRFSIKKKSQLGTSNYAYPNMTFQQFAWHVKDNLHEGDGGNFVIAYFSKDLANNLEEVQQRELNLLTQLQLSINHEIINSEYYIPAGMVLTDVDIKITSPQNSYTCEGELKNLKETIGPKRTISTNNKNIVFNYALLEDGQYIFEAICHDEYYQRENLTYSFTLEEDSTLSNPNPVMKAIANKTVTISIESESAAECEYIDRGNLNLGMNGKFTTKETLENGRIKHTATITPPADGVYIFQPVCQFEDQNIGHYLGNAGDFISFGIDHSAPKLTIYDTAQGLPETPEEYDDSLRPEESLTLQFECDDSQDILKYANSFDFSFGCKDMHYELKHTFPFQGITQINATGMLKTGDTKTFTAPNIFAFVNLHLNVSDKRGNYEIHNIKLRLRNMDYESPIVDICDPETQICI